MTENLQTYIKNTKQLIETEMIRALQTADIPQRLKQSMQYSLEAGGKRLRPILLFASYQAFAKQSSKKPMSTAIALEMIHTYSLIHDDLPAMDDDDYRRGKPTNHKVFDEATAILAGDGLLTYAFEIIANDSLLTSEEKVAVIGSLAKSSGPKGMVAGQILDMAAETNPVDIEGLEKIHTLKTGELLVFAVTAGALLGGATEQQLNELKSFAHFLGLIFQVQDDILDQIGDEEKLGKPVGSDVDNDKSTYPSLLGLNGAIAKKDEYTKQALHYLKQANLEGSRIEQLTTYFGQRDR